MIKHIFKKIPKLKGNILQLKQIISPLIDFTNLSSYIHFFLDRHKFIRMGGNAPIRHLRPRLYDKTVPNLIERHYFYQDVWAFKKIVNSKTEYHVDVGSRAFFVGMLTSIATVEFIDIRPLEIQIERYNFRKGSILDLPFSDETIFSLSCLHVVEHIGLGRYGDFIDPDGSKKGCRELERVLAPGGNLYLSLPVGHPKTCFNAHRVHSVEQVLYYFKGLSLIEFSVEDDEGNFYKNVSTENWDHLDYGCGMFWFQKHS